MKTKIAISILATICACTFLSGCNKEQPPAATEVAKPADAPKPADAAAAAASTAVDATKAAVSDATAQATTAANATQQQAQGLIDKAKSLLADQKYQEALGSLSQLSNFKLSSEQQTVVDNLKTQIQAAIAKAAGASGVGGALGGKQ